MTDTRWPKTEVVSVHPFRRSARRRERELQAMLDAGQAHDDLPVWAHGVRVRKAGRLQWAVEATEHHGR